MATGMGPIALGSDGGGSGTHTLKLLRALRHEGLEGRVALYPGCRDERHPGMSSWESLEHIGAMSRTVRDGALMLSDRLPVGMQIVGRHLDDPLVLRASAAFEAVRPWKDRWPPLLEELGL